MRKGFAKCLAGALAAQMILSGAGPLHYVVQAENFALEQDNSIEKVAVNGEVEVQIISGMEVRDDQKFLVKLNGPVQLEKEVVLSYEEGKEAPHRKVCFEGLKAGDYELQISGKNYVTYTQSIQVKDLGYRIQVYTGTVEGYENSESAHPGMLVYADVTEDGVLDEKDVEKLVNVIDENGKDTLCDLNGDDTVDLVDLQYFASFYGEKQTESTIETYIPKEALELVEETGTQVATGKLEDVLTGDGTVALKPTDGQAISEAHPVEVSFDFSKTEQPVLMEAVVIETPSGSENQIENGVVLVEYEDENGKVQVMELNLASPETRAAVNKKPDGTFVIDLGGQIAVKKVTLRVTATANKGNLAEISKVEFLNNMENRIPAPDMSIPTGVVAKAGNREITLTWEKGRNVTGYEVAISDGKATEYRRTTDTKMHIVSFQNDKLNNKQEYFLKVQSLNGEWKSGFGEAVKAVPMADTVPAAPDNLSVTELYRSLEIRWKESKDQAADTYNLYYKENGAADFEKVSGITGTYYKLDNLKDFTKYQLYVTGVNDLGEGPKSLLVAGTTAKVEAVAFPQYKIFTEADEKRELLTHVTNAKRGTGNMIDSPSDTGMSAKGIVDDNFASYYQLLDWDDAVNYHKKEWGLTVELEEKCTTDRIAFAAPDDSYKYGQAAVYYINDKGTEEEVSNETLLRKTSENGRAYYVIKLAEPITSKQIRIGVSTSNNVRNIGIAEVRIYSYDSLEKDIQNLYADDLHLELKSSVDASEIEKLQKRLDTKDHDEYHPDREILQKELDAAKKLLNDQKNLNDTVRVHPQITRSKDSHLKFSGLNAWQPLGVSAAAGEELVVYVGHPTMATGSNTSLRLVFSQLHAESNAAVSVMNTNLKIGRNEITVPKFMNTEVEKGGAIYVEYTGNNDKDAYGLRVSGGAKIPVLDLYKVTDKSEKEKRVSDYVKALEKHVSSLEKEHKELHQSGKNENVAYDYAERTCILNTTDILLDQMMISVPASQILAGLGNGWNKDDKLVDSMDAMNEMMRLFYQHKGLTDSFAEGTASDVVKNNRIPAQHLNIRYMKMFAGAFMYAGGNHIGIEWEQTTGMTDGKPVQLDKDGKKTGGQYFGWGIAHEIGHNINEPAYTVGEVTNNYFSVLAQADETNKGVRFEYEKVYDKVTSSAIGRDDNVFTQLGLYWQLHLAYDKDYNYTTYKTYQDMFKNLFYARVDSYARNPKSAPSPQGVALSLTDDTDQKLMRLASAAAQKDLTDFFTRWGMVPNDTTKAYVEQFEPETRAIYYGNDEARVYRTENKNGETVEGKDVVTANLSSEGSRVTLKMTSKAKEGSLIGYEIIRVTTEQGQPKKEVIGFTTTDRFVDQASHLGNRAVSYEVIAVDKFMNRSNAEKTKAVKLTGDGLQDKADWSVVTNMTSDEDVTPDADENDPCAPEKESASKRVIDGDSKTVYHGQSSKEDPYVILNMKKDTEVTALRYVQGDKGTPISAYRIEVSSDGQNYTKVKEGTFDLKNGTSTVFLTNKDIAGNEQADPWVATYNASYVKLTAVGQKGNVLSIGEVDILGPSGDDVELLTEGIGKLKTDYVYQEAIDGKEEQKIPAGSIVFTGTYKGNPAYNVVLLYDEKGNIVGGTDQTGVLKAQQIILAPNPGDALLGETSEGIWIYWLEPSDMSNGFVMPKEVRAELYRVDNALTNEGQRLVSDTLTVKVPEKLPEIEIKK